MAEPYRAPEDCGMEAPHSKPKGRSLQALKDGVQRARLIGAPGGGERQKDDFYATPETSTQALLRAESFDGDIWEPACGDGAISKVLEANGYRVASSDLVDRGYGEPRVDFLMEYKPRAPNIVTNPPFKLANDFARKALQMTTGKVALLLKVGFLEGKGRRDLYDDSPFARLLVFRERQTFLKNGDTAITMNGGGGMIAYGWFVWEHGYTGKPTLGWL
jgi:surface antigen